MSEHGGKPARWRKDFSLMSEKWDRAVAFAEDRLRRKEISAVVGWRESLGALIALRIELQKRGLWYHGRPDLLGVIGRGRREIYHSQVLAWLMDPGTPSGLGTAFLRRFLVLVDGELGGMPEDDLHHLTVTCEATGPNARTDLVVEGEGFVVAIEVKVDADEGTKQCDRVFLDWKDLPNPHFVFLTPTGRPPTTATGAARERFRKISFKDVREALVAAITDRGGFVMAAVGLEAPSDRRGADATCLTYLSTLDQEFL